MKASQSSRCDFEEDINERFMKEKKEKKKTNENKERRMKTSPA